MRFCLIGNRLSSSNTVHDEKSSLVTHIGNNINNNPKVEQNTGEDFDSLSSKQTTKKLNIELNKIQKVNYEHIIIHN